MTETLELPIDIGRIQHVLPHRYPFLLVDRVVEMEPFKRIVAHKNVSINEPFFQGHFPEKPVMPGVLVIESLAQAGGVLTQISRNTCCSDRLFYLVKINEVRFSRMVVPGDVLELHVEIKRVIRNMTLYVGVAKVDGNEVARAEILCAEMDKE
ncbi:3-hydroxyacyl-[acyl-carrier-protein] dehydratase FabZ [Pseudoxanthomonas kalamensis DSM 18571]|uniref:3-hydroxyacyl-ACP dehydratase FabZ n=1 Tax=Pseudoxanthomonas kalamensis TaxID=289483 RepID=UPI001390EC7E|nr:3-hydroxyacyl-ACP dehydratase FabZ [Pseudoxanthomonas kalamensis]KAF1708566.1 3-hydroxyacyl-[acyl-carrier-protein] dehydratase FabZ [Pseudoxanthomonas kalamensis DSM 18571]